MKFQKFTSLLDGEPADIAFLSTFQFDPDFFERRILYCPALSRARRIVIFIDASQWNDMLRHEVLARHLNRRYLVVPVSRSSGVFHPKLHLILKEKGAQVICGSNNLTRSGCASNLELLNSITFLFDNPIAAELDLAREAFSFFESACMHADDGIRRILKEWFAETAHMYPWIKDKISSHNHNPQLLHTYDGSIWKRLVDVIDPIKPKEFFIISPFHDADSGILKRLRKQWPQASVEVLVQQGYTNLDMHHLEKLSKIRLSEIQIASRRVHAKLIAWKSAKSVGCLVGSANFTSAALDGKNVEVCLLFKNADTLVGSLFDRQLSKKAIDFEDFEPGTSEGPEESKSELPSLRIMSAVLTDDDQLSVNYSNNLKGELGIVRLALRTPGEVRPRFSAKLSNKSVGLDVIKLPENVLSDSHGTILASIVAEKDKNRYESLPVWVIQERHLTFTPGEGSNSSRSRIEETGEGLPEFIDELGNSHGIDVVVDYLNHLSIRYYDGESSNQGSRKFRIIIRDPYHPDVAPEWLIHLDEKKGDLEDAIYEFVDRHERTRLLRHATRGNINGIENFLDIFKSLIRLLYVYCKRGIVKNARLVGYLCTFLRLATSGKDSEEENYEGYLESVFENIGHDNDLLKDVCKESNFAAEMWAALLIAQVFRSTFSENPKATHRATRPREALPSYVNIVESALRKCGRSKPNGDAVYQALQGYHMFSDEEIGFLLNELPK